MGTATNIVYDGIADYRQATPHTLDVTWHKMGNSIINTTTKEMVNLANWLTTPLYCGILIEGSQIAETNWEKRLMVYFAEKNQNIVGLGVVGINLSELEWEKSSFYKQKDFLSKVVNLAIKNKSYNKYIFKLEEEIAEPKLREIQDLISKLKFEDTNDSKFRFYFKPPYKISQICEEHRVYLNYFNIPNRDRCLICNAENSK